MIWDLGVQQTGLFSGHRYPAARMENLQLLANLISPLFARVSQCGSATESLPEGLGFFPSQGYVDIFPKSLEYVSNP